MGKSEETTSSTFDTFPFTMRLFIALTLLSGASAFLPSASPAFKPTQLNAKTVSFKEESRKKLVEGEEADLGFLFNN